MWRICINQKEAYYLFHPPRFYGYTVDTYLETPKPYFCFSPLCVDEYVRTCARSLEIEGIFNHEKP